MQRLSKGMEWRTMSDTWQKTPKGKKKDPRPPEKGGHVNEVKKAIQELEEEEKVDAED